MPLKQRIITSEKGNDKKLMVEKKFFLFLSYFICKSVVVVIYNFQTLKCLGATRRKIYEM